MGHIEFLPLRLGAVNNTIFFQHRATGVIVCPHTHFRQVFDCEAFALYIVRQKQLFDSLRIRRRYNSRMIIYEKGGFDGPAKLFRIHGSAVYKAILPAFLSTIISFIYDYADFAGMYEVNVPFVRKFFNPDDEEDSNVIRHPHTISAFIAIFRYDNIFCCWRHGLHF